MIKICWKPVAVSAVHSSRKIQCVPLKSLKIFSPKAKFHGSVISLQSQGKKEMCEEIPYSKSHASLKEIPKELVFNNSASSKPFPKITKAKDYQHNALAPAVRCESELETKEVLTTERKIHDQIKGSYDPAKIPQPTETHTTIGFVCKICDTRNWKSMSKQAYNHGVVIIRCDGCRSSHLIADHLGWYEHGKKVGKIEDFMDDVKKMGVERDFQVIEGNHDGEIQIIRNDTKKSTLKKDKKTQVAWFTKTPFNLISQVTKCKNEKVVA